MNFHVIFTFSFPDIHYPKKAYKVPWGLDKRALTINIDIKILI